MRTVGWGRKSTNGRSLSTHPPAHRQADPPADRTVKDKIGYTPVQYATVELAERMGNAGWDGASDAGMAAEEAGAGVADGRDAAPKRSCIIA